MLKMLNKKMMLSIILVHLLCICTYAQEFSGLDIFSGFQKQIKYPALTPDGDHLIFLALEDEKNNVLVAYESQLKNGNWTQPTPFEYINNLIKKSKNEVGGFSFNHDGTILYFHAKISTNFFDIYFAKKTKAGWGEPQLIGHPVSTGADLYSPTISSDDKTLFILQAKKEAERVKKNEPCKTLLMFEKNKANEWDGPKYLPKEFNIGCQETPFLAADNVSLYFASKRAEIDKVTGKKVSSNDNYNIYFARRIDENNWYYPVYVSGINTEYDDLSPMLNSSGNYFIYNTKPIRKLPYKLYKNTLAGDKKPFPTYTVKGTITDLYSKQPIEAKIAVQNSITSVIKGEFKTNDEGQYSVILTQGAFYKIDFSDKGYSHTYFYKDLNTIGKEQSKKFDVTLYKNVNLELNIYDNELFYPVSPTVSVFDSLTKQPLAKDKIVNVSKGKYNCNLNIGNLYKIRIESNNFATYETSLDLRTDVLYSDFEKSLELKATRKELTLNITDQQRASILPVNVTVKNLTRDEEFGTLVSYEKSGKPVLMLRTNNRYELNVSKTGYTYHNSILEFKTTENETLNIALDLLTSQTVMVFNNITFETNSAELNSESYAELNRIVDFMKNNPGIKIEIAAHTDDIGADAYNFRLSDKRAESVVKFLTNNIQKERLRSKGYGKTQPVVPNDSDANRAKNRRVEIKIIDNTN